MTVPTSIAAARLSPRTDFKGVVVSVNYAALTPRAYTRVYARSVSAASVNQNTFIIAHAIERIMADWTECLVFTFTVNVLARLV